MAFWQWMSMSGKAKAEREGLPGEFSAIHID